MFTRLGSQSIDLWIALHRDTACAELMKLGFVEPLILGS